MIDQRFLDDLAQDLKLPDEPQQDMQLASANTGVTTDGGAFVGYRMNMPKGLNTPENMAKQSVLIADTMAGGGKGAVQGFVGLPGDLESIGRMALNYLGYNVDENTAFPTSEEIGKRLESVLGPVIPPNQTTGVPTEERVRAAEGGTTGGELIAPGGQLKLASKVAKPVIGATKKIIEAGKDLPVGMSIKGVDESLDPLGFYSAASKAVDNIAQDKGTGQQFLAQIEKTPGVKKEELLWTGLDEFLAGKKSVTKAEVQEYLNANRVEVKEVTLNQGARPYRYVTADEWQGAINDAERVGNFDEAERITAAWENFELGGGSNRTKFAKYTLPGGENYREVLLTLPSKNKARDSLGGNPSELSVADAIDEIGASEDDFTKGSTILYYPSGAYIEKLPNGEYSALVDRTFKSSKNLEEIEEFVASSKLFDESPQGSKDFQSQHFDQPNVLAHMRLNDRVDADGKKVLFVEEVQSDWHQTGRKRGYKNPNAEKQILEIEKKMLDMAGIRDPITNEIADEEKFVALFRKKDELLKQAKGVPDAPFKTSWHELALKRAIQLASEGGYDRIAFTTGKTQAERYDLSKQIDTIDYQKLDDGRYKVVAGKGGRPLMIEALTEDKLSDFVGKDVADKIIKGEGKKYPEGSVSQDMTMLSGVDLQLGGEGMKGFYDTILPKYLDKYGKKWDAKTGMTKIRLASDAEDAADSKLLKDLGMDEGGKATASVHYMDITPKMKESVLTKGQPLFQMAPAIPAGAAATQMQEENK